MNKSRFVIIFLWILTPLFFRYLLAYQALVSVPYIQDHQYIAYIANWNGREIVLQQVLNIKGQLSEGRYLRWKNVGEPNMATSTDRKPDAILCYNMVAWGTASLQFAGLIYGITLALSLSLSARLQSNYIRLNIALLLVMEVVLTIIFPDLPTGVCTILAAPSDCIVLLTSFLMNTGNKPLALLHGAERGFVAATAFGIINLLWWMPLIWLIREKRD